MHYTIPKGVFDILPHRNLNLEDEWKSSEYWYYVESVLRQCAQDYGFKEIRTPLFERTELFIRGVGESSDIVTKEMYTFLDKGDRSMTLRPEGTAPVARAFVEHHLDQVFGLHKYFYLGPMFRYERPQAGRYRQHYQFGVETFGSPVPQQDVEVIDLLLEVYRRLQVRGFTLMINTVGDQATRDHYRKALISYLEPHFHSLSEESQARFSKNVLRILDSKSPSDQKILEKAPSILDFLSEESLSHFSKIQKILHQLGIPFVINPKLVRGLDYYHNTVFEVICETLGAQNSLGGGGRYDGLIADLGGPPTPSVGFALGIERLLQTVLAQGNSLPSVPGPKIFLVPMGQEALDYCFVLTSQLRHNHITAEIDLSGKKVQSSLQLANIEKAEYCLVIGDRELQTQEIELKHLSTRHVQKMPISQLTHFLTQHNNR